MDNLKLEANVQNQRLQGLLSELKFLDDSIGRETDPKVQESAMYGIVCIRDALERHSLEMARIIISLMS